MQNASSSPGTRNERRRSHRGMRRFQDRSGASWDGNIGKESWGTLVLLFSPRHGGGPRKTVLAVETAFEAERVLDAMSDEDLQQRLAESVAWE